MEFEEVIDELYGVAPDRFVAARAAAASAARREGDREHAQAITRLRRPSMSAWLTNQLVREAGRELEALLELGPAMSAAQERLDGDELRRLSEQRRAALEALVGQAESIARRMGREPSARTLQEVEATLQAALADPGAADALRRARLTSELSYSGFGTAPSAPSVPAVAHSREEKVRLAEEFAATAHRVVEERRHQLEVAASERDRLASRLEALASQISVLRAEASAAGRSLRDAERHLHEAERDAAKADQAVRRSKI